MRPNPTTLTTATQRSLGRRARRKVEIRTRILRAALDLFARQGFFVTTVGQITEAADVGKGTFFNYFPTKEHVLAGFGEMQVARVQAALREARTGRRPIRDVLQRLIYSLAEEPKRSQPLVRNLMVANLSSEPVRQLFRRQLLRGRRLLAELFFQGQQRGEIGQERKPAELARLFQQTFLGAMLLWGIQPPSPLARWLKLSFELFWSAISARGGGKR